MDIAGKIVLLTGASEGIGLATARLFAKLGARVALVARSEEKLQQLANALPDALAVPADMRDETAVQAMVRHVSRSYGRIDVLVNNVGQGLHVPVEHADIEQYRALFQLNVVGVLSAMQAVIPLMRKQGGGVIVNISSGTTKTVIPHVGPYASTKAALNTLTLTARLELAPENIRVGLVYPGITATDFMKHAASVQMNTDRQQMMPIESPEQVTEKIGEAIRTEAAEVFAESLTSRR
ncbi:short-chain dehydrogenase [Ktedonobacter sp. SOSP1-52]|uniref:SDR family oxidoreductase n=1 Tax=Ktedonobacter sp. SOSP1-52 TaxID=2778366 RepID=UPI0019158B86|nr:SDR family oxidoreductase [Ktedonobacter sp. SOSP1-52]GHO62938.1 short-chain dehydrogenase [Ktedonobacter sp. SOSP1-52]